MAVHRGAIVALGTGLVVATGTRIVLAHDPFPAALLGVVYGCYAWALWGYPLARRFHFRRLEGRDFWLGPALLVAVGAALAIPASLTLPPRPTALLFLSAFGGLLAVGTLAGLLAHNEGLIDHDWR
jgi:hypothetical protein